MQADSFPPENPRSYHKWLIESFSNFLMHFGFNPEYTASSAKQTTFCPHLPFSFVLDASQPAAEPRWAQAHTLRSAFPTRAPSPGAHLAPPCTPFSSQMSLPRRALACHLALPPIVRPLIALGFLSVVCVPRVISLA